MRAGSEYPPFNVRAEVLYLCLFHRTLINLLPVACCTVGVLPALPLRGPHQGSVQKIMPGVSFQQCCCYLGGLCLFIPSAISVEEPCVLAALAAQVISSKGEFIPPAMGASLLSGSRTRKVLGWPSEHPAGFSLRILTSGSYCHWENLGLYINSLFFPL